MALITSRGFSCLPPLHPLVATSRAVLKRQFFFLLALVMLMRCTVIPKYRVSAHGNPYSFPSFSPSRKYQEDVNKCLSIGVAVSFFIFTFTVNCASHGDAVSRLLPLFLLSPFLSRAVLLFAPHYSPQSEGANH